MDATQVLDEVYHLSWGMMKLSALNKEKFSKLIHIFNWQVRIKFEINKLAKLEYILLDMNIIDNCPNGYCFCWFY